MLVGGIHTGFEANTVDLMEELIAHFRQSPADVLGEVTLLIIPVLNPDGIPFGRQLRGRFNANGVDLNRNWGCRWQPEAVFGDMEVDPGPEPFSEPETRALGALIQQTQPAAVLFYHAAANGVFAGRCEEGVSDELTQIYAEAARYPYGDDFGDGGNGYEVTGDASVWVDGQGIPAVIVELATSTQTEFVRNLRAVMALQRWLLQQ